MPELDLYWPNRLIFGEGSLSRLGTVTRELGAKRCLIVSDRGIERAGHVQRAITLLQAADIDIALYVDVEENPTTDHVDAATAQAREAQVDLFIGLGGGSAMDTAKGANFLLCHGGKMADFWGVGKATRPMRPMIAVPTTSGTGSEAQSFALIADAKTHQKMACGDRKAMPSVALLDPQLTFSQPAGVTAVCGIDALSHALESHVTTKRNPVSQMFSRESFRRLALAFPRVLANGNDSTARGDMQLGAYLAGAAIEASMLGATHSLANPLSAHFGTTHGLAIGIMLPHVLRYNDAVAGEGYADLLRSIGKTPGPQPGHELATLVEEWLKLAKLPTKLGETGVGKSVLDNLAREAASQWTAQFNPRSVTQHDLEMLYDSAF